MTPKSWEILGSQEFLRATNTLLTKGTRKERLFPTSISQDPIPRDRGIPPGSPFRRKRNTQRQHEREDHSGT
jgi:hypothetical protein